jgi:peptidoglycan/LPS O-acetylase OafA/YrhL
MEADYRPDIDGLRALAVLGVVIFHFSPARLSGGYVGVDVFFVISGFLISKIILGEIRDGKFSYWRFYARRIRRIFPALIVVLIATALIGFTVLLIDEHVRLSEDLIASALFFYNFVLANRGGYFDAPASASPLLHLWSLGIEEQFYLFWPVTLVLIASYASRRFIVGGLAAASFCLNAYFVYENPTATFYLPFFRLWEFMIGCLLLDTRVQIERFIGNVTVISQRSVAILLNSLSVGGLAMIAFSMLRFNAELYYPGFYALMPTVGTALIILAGPGAFLNRTALSWRPIVFLGLISYPLYLWHWPALFWGAQIEAYFDWGSAVLPLTNFFNLPGIKILSLLAALLLAIATYRLLEMPIRHNANLKIIAAILTAVLFVAFPGGLLAKISLTRAEMVNDDRARFLNSFSWEPDSNFRRSVLAAYRTDCSFLGEHLEVKQSISPSCFTVGKGRTVFLWGDSHAQHLRPGFEAIARRALESDSIQIAQITSGACTPGLEPLRIDTPTARACNLSNALAEKSIAALKPDILVMTQANYYFQTDWPKLIEGVKKLGAKQVIVVGPVPRWRETLPRLVAYRFWPEIPIDLGSYYRSEFFKIDRQLRSQIGELAGVRYISALDYFCHDAMCRVSMNGQASTLTSYDGGHLTPVASEHFVADVFGDLLLPPRGALGTR